ncbi:MAG: hypothetical protein COA77_08460 [Thaumarchaeota archaeon]|nr:MAG: hypothetical protein COA77_08460 [Nitrososphaerota archaeon]
MNENNLLDEKFTNILFETIPDMLAILDKNGKILFCNSQFVKNSRFEKKELIGMIAPVDLVHKDDREKALSAFEQVVTEGIHLNVQLNVIRKDKTVFPSLWSGSVLKDKSETVQGYLITGKDLTVIDNLKNELKQLSTQKFNEHLLTIGELSARLSHDIRNPLGIIRMAIENMHNAKNKPDGFEASIERCNRSIDRITHQINDVMDFVRQKPLTLTNNYFLEILNSSILSMNIPKSIKIIKPKDDFVLYCDPEQIQVVFSNLILNSIQALSQNGQIDISILQNNDSMEIIFADSGIPIPEKIMPKIFEPLFTTKQMGTGLGLVSCKTIIESHGGSIRVKNNPTRFEITLPKPIIH